MKRRCLLERRHFTAQVLEAPRQHGNQALPGPLTPPVSRVGDDGAAPVLLFTACTASGISAECLAAILGCESGGGGPAPASERTCLVVIRYFLFQATAFEMAPQTRSHPIEPIFGAKSLRVSLAGGGDLARTIAGAPRRRLLLEFSKRGQPRDVLDHKIPKENVTELAANAQPPWLPAKVLLLALEPRDARASRTAPNPNVPFEDLQFFAMDPDCPHAGGPLEIGDIEDVVSHDAPSGSEPVILCPLHLFDFSLTTGKSSVTDSKMSVYNVSISGGALEISGLWWGEQGIEVGRWWDVSAREVETKDICGDRVDTGCVDSEVSDLRKLSLDDGINAETPNLLLHLQKLLNTADIRAKAAGIRELKKVFDSGNLPLGPRSAYKPPDIPPREAGVILVDPRKVKRRGFGSLTGRLGMLHALANIESWAMDLGMDIMLRFAAVSVPSADKPAESEEDYLPREYFADFLKLVDDEAKHFTMLAERLDQLGSPFPSKDFPCHIGLWDAAAATSDNLLDRLCIVHMVHEARGLDVNPETLSKFALNGDQESADMLGIIHEDEITHVAYGVKWFEKVCAARGWDPVATFKDVLDRQRNGKIKPPWNDKDRARAGLKRAYYAEEVQA